MAIPIKKKKKRGRVSSVLVFLLAFIVFLLVFGGLCLWAVVKINEERDKSSVSSLASDVSGIVFEPEDARNLLIILADSNAADGFVLIRMDPAAGRLYTLALPRETNAVVGTNQARLSELYDTGGPQAVKEAVAALLDMDMDNYAVLTYANLEKMVTYFNNGIIFDLTEAVNFQSEDGKLFLQLDQGKQTLSATQASKLLRVTNWQGGRRQRARVTADLTAAFINQYLVSGRSDKAQQDFERLVNLVRTDIRVSHFNQAKPALRELAARNSGAVCTALTVEGEYTGSGDKLTFHLSESLPAPLSSPSRP